MVIQQEERCRSHQQEASHGIRGRTGSAGFRERICGILTLRVLDDNRTGRDASVVLISGGAVGHAVLHHIVGVIDGIAIRIRSGQRQIALRPSPAVCIGDGVGANQFTRRFGRGFAAGRTGAGRVNYFTVNPDKAINCIILQKWKLGWQLRYMPFFETSMS